MRIAGIDIGSRTIKIVVIDHSANILEKRYTLTTYDALSQIKRLIDGLSFDYIQATGYGRNLFQEAFKSSTVSEILAHAAGVRNLYPEARGVLDIGGQDTKVISLSKTGKILKFEMNDKCAAGTGKFLEVMALSFGIDIDDFGEFAMRGESPSNISSMCTVFAESETTSLIAKGEKPENIALGLHQSIVRRSVSMLKRQGISTPLVFTGGVALNPCMKHLLKQELNGGELIVPVDPHLMGAYGAAILLLKD
jgi:(R)-2-hydroxyacyl-CoA dehydratese activating ATPase